VRGGAPRAAGALFFGDSITYGIGLQNEELFTNLVEARLNAAQPAPGWCVMNFAQPGYGFEQSLAVAREEIPRQRPAVVLFEFWAIGRSYRMLGDSAYDVDAYRLRGAGFPAVRYGWLIPNALNRLAVHALGGLPFFCADLRGHRPGRARRAQPALRAAPRGDAPAVAALGRRARRVLPRDAPAPALRAQHHRRLPGAVDGRRARGGAA
jgi:hypothetical protein